jgi:hypothetical protein
MEMYDTLYFFTVLFADTLVVRVTLADLVAEADRVLLDAFCGDAELAGFAAGVAAFTFGTAADLEGVATGGFTALAARDGVGALTSDLDGDLALAGARRGLADAFLGETGADFFSAAFLTGLAVFSLTLAAGASTFSTCFFGATFFDLDLEAGVAGSCGSDTSAPLFWAPPGTVLECESAEAENRALPMSDLRLMSGMNLSMTRT